MWVICFALQTQSGVKNQLDYKKQLPLKYAEIQIITFIYPFN